MQPTAQAVGLNEETMQSPEGPKEQRLLSNHRRKLLFDEHQLAIFDLEVFDIGGQLQLVALFGKFLL